MAPSIAPPRRSYAFPYFQDDRSRDRRLCSSTTRTWWGSVLLQDQKTAFRMSSRASDGTRVRAGSGCATGQAGRADGDLVEHVRLSAEEVSVIHLFGGGTRRHSGRHKADPAGLPGTGRASISTPLPAASGLAAWTGCSPEGWQTMAISRRRRTAPGHAADPNVSGAGRMLRQEGPPKRARPWPHRRACEGSERPCDARRIRGRSSSRT